MELYRRSHILERLLSLLASPSLPVRQQEMVVGLLYRYIYVGGSTTLITRCSLLSWAPSYLALNDKGEKQATAVRKMVERCKADCDQQRVHDWSSGKLVKITERKRGSIDV